MEHKSEMAPAGGAPSAEHRGGVGHIVPTRLLVAVWLALMVLTVVTVAAAAVNVGEFNLWVAMIIATIKASMVVLYFMHLRWDRPFNAIIFIIALSLVALFVGLALTDTSEYQPQLIEDYAPAIGS